MHWQKKIGGNKTVVEKKSTQKSSTGLKITGTTKRLNGKRRNRGGVKKHDYTRCLNRDSRISGGNDLTDARDILIITRIDKLFDEERNDTAPSLLLQLGKRGAVLYDRRRSCFHRVSVDTVYARRFETRSRYRLFSTRTRSC